MARWLLARSATAEALVTVLTLLATARPLSEQLRARSARRRSVPRLFTLAPLPPQSAASAPVCVTHESAKTLAAPLPRPHPASPYTCEERVVCGMRGRGGATREGGGRALAGASRDRSGRNSASSPRPARSRQGTRSGGAVVRARPAARGAEGKGAGRQ